MTARVLSLVFTLGLASCTRVESPQPPAPQAAAKAAPRAHYEGATAPNVVRALCAPRPAADEKLCARFVGGAAGAGHLTIRAAEACIKASKLDAECPAPPLCREALVGTRGEKQSCRSNLECLSGLACHGLTATDPGVCGPPRGLREPCGTVDPLAASVGVDPLLDHRDCKDFCDDGTCAQITMLGQPCTRTLACGAGAWCGPDKTCRPGVEPVPGC